MYRGTGRGEEQAPGLGGGALGPGPRGAGLRPPAWVPPRWPPWEVHSLSAPFGLPAAAPHMNQGCPAGWGPRLHDLMALSLIVAQVCWHTGWPRGWGVLCPDCWLQAPLGLEF